MNPEPINHLRLQIIVCWLLLVGLLNAAPPPNPGTIRLVTKETSLGKVPLMADPKKLVVSPDHQHVAFPVMRGGQWTVWHDGVESGKFKVISKPMFSPDGKRLAYVGARGVVSQEESRSDTIEQTSVTMKFFWGKAVVVVDGKAGQEYESVGHESLRFSPDSQRLAYTALKGGKRMVVVDDKVGPEFDGIGKRSLLFSPDSQRVAYVGMREDIHVAVVDGVEDPPLNPVEEIQFSPDSQHIAYIGQRDSKQFMVVDGKEGEQYDGIPTFVFSPDSRKVAHVAYRKIGGEGGKKGMVVVNGDKGPEFDGIGDDSLTFSPDSQRLAYGAVRGSKQLLVLDGQEGPEFDGIGAGSLLFSPDSQHIAYVGERGSKQFMMIDGQESKEYDGIRQGTPLFSSDSRHLVWVARRGNERLVVVDGKETQQFDLVWPLVFVGPKQIRFLATQFDESFNKELLRVEIEIVEEPRPTHVPGAKK